MTQPGALVRLTDTTLRDGIQFADPLPLAVKLDLFGRLAAFGPAQLEIGAFVSPSVMPQFADAEKFWALTSAPKARRIALVANTRGVERALRAGADGVSVTGSSDAVTAAARAGLSVRAYLSSASVSFGTDPLEVIADGAARLLDAGADRIMIADESDSLETTRFGDTVDALASRVRPERLGVHLHRGHHRSVAKLERALDAGVRDVDATVGGAGGHPPSWTGPRWCGNIATRVVVDVCARRGIKVDIGEQGAFDSFAEEARAWAVMVEEECV